MKIVCIYHKIDLDGWMSAAIVKKWFEEENNGFNTSPSDNSIDFIGYNYNQHIPDLSVYDKVIMVDISFPKEIMHKLFNEYRHNFTWIDHHVSAIKDFDFTPDGIQNVKYAACELTWKYFYTETEMPEIVRILGRYDCFGHKGTAEELKVLQFQYGARQEISNLEDAYKWLNWCINEEFREQDLLKAGHFIYGYLCTEAKQTYSQIFTIELDGYKFACVNKERFNPINFGIDYHKDGFDGFVCFSYKDGKFMYSIYNDNEKVDVSIIAKNRGGGGHKGASGFISDILIKE